MSLSSRCFRSTRPWRLRCRSTGSSRILPALPTSKMLTRMLPERGLGVSSDRVQTLFSLPLRGKLGLGVLLGLATSLWSANHDTEALLTARSAALPMAAQVAQAEQPGLHLASPAGAAAHLRQRGLDREQVAPTGQELRPWQRAAMAAPAAQRDPEPPGRDLAEAPQPRSARAVHGQWRAAAGVRQGTAYSSREPGRTGVGPPQRRRGQAGIS